MVILSSEGAAAYMTTLIHKIPICSQNFLRSFVQKMRYLSIELGRRNEVVVQCVLEEIVYLIFIAKHVFTLFSVKSLVSESKSLLVLFYSLRLCFVLAQSSYF